MKRVALMLSLALGISLLAGCSEVKRKVEETGRGITEHALSKAAGNAQDAGDAAVNKSVDGATTSDKQSQDRNALNGNSDDSDNKDNK
jgi:hypothetical protein